MEFCYPQDFLDEIPVEIHSARKNRQITASLLQKKRLNQGAREARKIRQINLVRSGKKYWFSERVEEDLNLKMIKLTSVFFGQYSLRTHRPWYKIKSVAAERTFYW